MHWGCCLHYHSITEQTNATPGWLCRSLCYLPCPLLDKNHRPLLYSDRNHSWNDPSASLIFLGMALMIKCRFAFPVRSRCLLCYLPCPLLDKNCTVITRIADLAILILVRCKLADSLLTVVARVDDCLVWVGRR